MRRYFFDHFEFDPPSSEQSLELAISSPSQHNEFDSFLKSCKASSTGSSTPSSNWSRWQQVSDHLKELVGIAMPHPSQLRTATIINDDWNDAEIAFAFESYLIWYHWLTSA